jgi:hypothetical protein
MRHEYLAELPVPSTGAPEPTPPDVNAVRDFLESRCNGHPDCQTPHEAFDRIAAALASSQSEVARLMAALREYGVHHADCKGGSQRGILIFCSCGLSRALTENTPTEDRT